MDFPENLRFTKDHEWLNQEGRVGITEYAQEALGDVVYVELPNVGSVVVAGERAGVIESVKSVSDFYSPVSGRVIRINTQLLDQPELVNQSPYERGWLFEVGESAPGELMSPENYQAFLERGE